MTALKSLLKEIEIKPCTDTWHPWCKTRDVHADKKDLRQTVLGWKPRTIPNDPKEDGGVTAGGVTK